MRQPPEAWTGIRVRAASDRTGGDYDEQRSGDGRAIKARRRAIRHFGFHLSARVLLYPSAALANGLKPSAFFERER